MKKELYDMLASSAEADKKKALLTLDLLDDRLNTLEKYFKISKRRLNG